MCVSLGLVTQHAKRIGPYCIVICGLLAGSTTLFPTFSHKPHDFRGKRKVIEHKMWVFIFSANMAETFTILKMTQRDAFVFIARCTVVQCEVPVILGRLYGTVILSTRIGNFFKYQISRNALQWEPSCCMRTDGRTGGREAEIRFSHDLKRSYCTQNVWFDFLCKLCPQLFSF